MEEIWKSIYYVDNDGILHDYRGSYQISSFGRVRSLNRLDSKGRSTRGKILKQNDNQNGYKSVFLCKNGQRKKYSVHRLVGYMFIYNDDPKNKTQINHIDENKQNNTIDNLEWVTPKENMNYGSARQKTVDGNSKKIIGKSKKEVKVIIIKSSTIAEKFGFDRSVISSCCYGHKKSHKGYYWSFLDKRVGK